MATTPISQRKSDALRQKALDRLSGDPSDIRRPLTGYESLYEVTSAGALYSVRLQRFLKPVFEEDNGTAFLEFEYDKQTIRVSPGKAVATSFFSKEQRERVADEAYETRVFDSMATIKGNPAIDVLAKKYGVSSAAIFYILLASLVKTGQSQH